MKEMFKEAASFNQDISNWNISNVTDMADIFLEANSLSDRNSCSIHQTWSSNDNWPYDWSDLCFQPQTKEELQTVVDLWTDDNPSALETYGEINTWDVSLIIVEKRTDCLKLNIHLMMILVIGMSQMSLICPICLLHAHAFNQDLNSWDVSNVQNMGGMFANAHAFNQDLNSWDVSNVNYVVYMFYRAYSFNGIFQVEYFQCN